MPPVEVEFFRRQAGEARLLVQFLGLRHLFGPGFHRMDVDLDHAGIGRDGERRQPLIGGRQIAFQHDAAAGFRRRFPRWRRADPASPRPRTAAAGTRASCRRAARPPARSAPGRVRPVPMTGSSCATGRKPSMPLSGAISDSRRCSIAWRGGKRRAWRERIGFELRSRSCRDQPRECFPEEGGGRWESRREPGTSRRRGRTSCRIASGATRYRSRAATATRCRRALARPWPNTLASRARSSGSSSFGVLGQHVGGQAALAPEVVMRVLMRRDHQAGIDLQPFRQPSGEVGGIGRRGGLRSHAPARTARCRARPAPHPRARGNETPSAAVARRDIACP